MGPPIDKDSFGRFVFEERRRLGLTQKNLAEQLYVSNQAVSKWERGQSLPDVELLIPLAEILGVTVTELLEGRRLQTGEKLEQDAVEHLIQKVLLSFPVSRVASWVFLLFIDMGIEWSLFSYCDWRQIPYFQFVLPLRLLFFVAGYFLLEQPAAGISKNKGLHLLLSLTILSVFLFELTAILFWDHPDKGFIVNDVLRGMLWLLFLTGIFLVFSKAVKCDLLLFHHFMTVLSSILVFLSDQGFLVDYEGKSYLLISNSLWTYLISTLVLCVLAFLSKQKTILAKNQEDRQNET